MVQGKHDVLIEAEPESACRNGLGGQGPTETVLAGALSFQARERSHRGASWRRHAWLCTLILLVALAVRLPALGEHSWWIDELVTRNTGRLALWRPGAFSAKLPATHSMVGFSVQDIGPGPLTYLLEGAFARWAEPLGGEFWLRIPGVAAGMACVALLLVWGRRWGVGRRGALAMAAFGAVYPPWVEWSTGARGYAWCLLVGLVQLGLLCELAREKTASGRVRGSGLLWGALVFSVPVAMLINPIHSTWNAAVLAGVLAARVFWKRSRIATLPRAGFWGGIAGAVSLCGSWGALWVARVLPQRAGGAADGASIMYGRLLEFLRQAVHSPGIGVALLAGVIFVCTFPWLWRRKSLRPVLVVFAVALGGFALLSLVMLRKQFLATRYVYSVTLLSCWLFGFGVQRLALVVAARRGSAGVRRFDSGVAGGLVALMALIGWPTAREVAVPVHDWSGAVRWMQTRVQPGDLVLCGPNSDSEIFRTYAQAAKLQAAVPRWIQDASGVMHYTSSEKALGPVLKGKGRVWFVTAFWGIVRSAGYWEQVKANFREVARIPGQGEIRILLREER